MSDSVDSGPRRGGQEVTAVSIYPPTIFSRITAQNLDVFAAGIVTLPVILLARALSIPEHLVGVVGYATFAFSFLAADALPNGQSVGKRLLGLSVVHNATGAPCSLGRSLARNLFVVLGIVDWAFMIGRSRRRLGDYAAATRVVRVSRGSA